MRTRGLLGASLLAAAALLVLFAPVAEATVLKMRTLAELVARADRVDLAVVESRAFRDGGELGFTETTLRVTRTYKGAPRERIVVTQLGGERGGVATELVGDARLLPGERFVLLTWLAPDGRRYLVGMGLGALRVRGDVATQEVDAAFVDGEGALHPGPFVHDVPLAELERTTREAARGAP